MARVGLINREVGEGKNIYRTNPEAIRRFAQRIVQVLNAEAPDQPQKDPRE